MGTKSETILKNSSDYEKLLELQSDVGTNSMRKYVYDYIPIEMIKGLEQHKTGKHEFTVVSASDVSPLRIGVETIIKDKSRSINKVYGNNFIQDDNDDITWYKNKKGQNHHLTDNELLDYKLNI